MSTEAAPGTGYFQADEERQRDFEETWAAARPPLSFFKEINNIPIAKRYILASFLFLFTGGFMAMLMRTQLAVPENEFLDPKTYNQLFTMHGTTMMFLFVIPFLEALANYMLPLLLGTRDLPFPRLTALAFWTYFLGGIFLYASFLFGVAPNGGWFAYVPLTGPDFSPGINMDWWDIGLSVAEIAAMGAAAEIIVSVMRMRAAGMSLDRAPLYVWAMLVTGFMIIFAFTPLIVATAMLELDRKNLTAFFDVAAGGDPLLWQHLFWIFGHPDVYIMFIPAVGIVSHIIQVFSRRPLVGYPFVIFGMIAVGFLSFGLWVHHMFTTGLPHTSMGIFAAVSMMIAIPSGVQVFCWIATLWTGRPVWRTPLLFCVGFLFLFVAGGLTGVMVASIPFDTQAHDSYFVVGHFHYVMAGAVVFPIIAGLYYWLPKVTGRMLSERLGRWNFWVMFVSFNLAFFPMHISGLLGMPRRIASYPAGLGWEPWNLLSTVGAIAFAGGVALFVVNFFWSLRYGSEAGRDPWHADTLEWSQTSPPAAAQFQTPPVVRSRHPMWEQETLAPADPEMERSIEMLRWRPLRWRAALVTTVVYGEPDAIVHVPGPTLWPFAMSVAFVTIFAGLLFDQLLVLGAGGVGTAVTLVGWFWPKESERLALAEVPTRADDEHPLPLAVAGPSSSGWWGTAVFVSVLAVALACTIGSYFYIGDPGGRQGPPLDATALSALLGAFASLAAGAAMLLAQRGVAREQNAAAGVGVVSSLVLTAANFWLTMRAFAGLGLDPAASGYASVVVGLFGFQWLVDVILVVMLLFATVWALARPGDVRGHAVALNAALVAYFGAASGVITVATAYFGPRLW
ncbi:MAG: cytochrome c oxidase subunit I [Longimicrobiales bacterium]